MRFAGFRFAAAVAVVCTALAVAATTNAETYYWYGSDTAALGGDGTWQAGTGAYWATDTTSPSMVTWTNSDSNTAYFAGAVSKSTVTVSGAVSTGGLTLNSRAPISLPQLVAAR
jgi:hypothetical protein